LSAARNRPHFEIDREQPTQASMEKEQIEVVVLVVDRDSLLASKKTEVRAQFQQELL
jgi:hypothetical protein